MMQGDTNLKEALEKNFHNNKLSIVMYIKFSSNSTRHKVRLTRKERLECVQMENLISVNKVVNIKNTSPRLQGDSFSDYLVLRSSKCSFNEGSNSENPRLKSKYIINWQMYNIKLMKSSDEPLRKSKLTWSSHACSRL